MIYVVLVFLSFLQSVIGFTLMSSSVMHFKEPVVKRIVIGFLVMLLGIILLSYTLYTRGIDSVNSYAILVILVIELSWFLICSADRFYVSVFNFLTFVNIYVSISYISDTLSMGFEGVAYVSARIIIRTVIYIIVLPLLFKFVRKHFRMLVGTIYKEWRVATLVPLMFLVIQIMVLYYPAPYWRWASNSWSNVIIITVYVLFLAVYYLLYVQASAIVEKYALEKRQLLMAQQEKLWESELIRQKTTATLANQQKHDLHHHNAVIMGLLLSNDMGNLKEYMKNYDASMDEHYTNSYCLNPIVNSIINFYANRADKENIKTSFNISVPENIGIENIDLTCVIGNALENALEGCLRVPDDQNREITVIVKYFDNRLRIMIENTSGVDVVFEGELPTTQKVGGGTGTKSILYTAERYDGTAGFSLVDGKFVTQIVLNGK